MRAFWSKWGLCQLLFLATTLNYLDRQTLSILAPTLQDEMHLDNKALGWLFSIFYYSYTFSQFAVGMLLDRSHLRWAFGLAVLAWSVVSALTGLAQGFVGLLICRFLLGVAESPNWPAALRIVARALPPEDRTLGNGIFTSGTRRRRLVPRADSGAIGRGGLAVGRGLVVEPRLVHAGGTAGRVPCGNGVRVSVRRRPGPRHREGSGGGPGARQFWNGPLDRQLSDDGPGSIHRPRLDGGRALGRLWLAGGCVCDVGGR